MSSIQLTVEEKRLMDELMADLDDAFFEDIVLTPEKKRSPTKHASGRGASSNQCAVSVISPFLNSPSRSRPRHRHPSSSPSKKQLIIGRNPISKPHFARNNNTKLDNTNKENAARPKSTLPRIQPDIKSPAKKPPSALTVRKPSTPLKAVTNKNTIHVDALTPRSKQKLNKAEAEALMDGLGDLSDWDWDDDISDGETTLVTTSLSQSPTQLPPRIKLPASTFPSLPSASTATPISVASSLKSICTTSPPPEYQPDPCTRCVVEEIIHNNTSRYSAEKHLLVRVDEMKKDQPVALPKSRVARLERADWRLVELKDDWILTEVRTGDVVNVIGSFLPINSTTLVATFQSPHKPKSKITLTSLKNTIILHPDLLLTATAVANTSHCTRKAIINALIPTPITSPTPALVWGNMLHEVVQQCFGEGRWDKQFVEAQIDDVVRTDYGLGELVKVEVGVERAKEEVRARAVGLEGFSKRFIGVNGKPKDDAELTDPRAGTQHRSLLALTGLHDVEEDIWSPIYGIKGKVDASVQAVVEEKDDKLHRSSSSGWTMPFEIKTGKANAGLEHRAQTMLYTLLMRERYGVEVPSGLLYYTQTDQLIRIASSRQELRGLIIGRNELAAYMMRRQPKFTHHDDDEAMATTQSADSSQAAQDMENFLPPTIDQAWACKKCYVSDACMLYRKAVEKVDDTTSEISELYDIKTSHLTPERSEFFKKWEALLSLEEHDMIRFRKELWTMTASQRETRGRCFANMVVDVDGYKEEKGPTVARVHRHTYRFVRANQAGEVSASSSVTATAQSNPPSREDSLLNGLISKGDAVMISIEPDLLALARGFVIELTPSFVVLGVDHAINVDGVLARTRSASSLHRHNPSTRVLFRLDRDEMSAGMSRIRYNLANLFFADGGDTKRLELVVDLRKPDFDEEPEGMAEQIARVSDGILNPSQQAAMRKVLTARDYALILGMPGTGKTTSIAEIIKELVKRNKTVLLTSYTHSAVDTTLLKLKDVDFEILRLGNVDKVHPDVRHFCVANRTNATSFEQLERQLCNPPVVATTCLTIDHALFSRRKFDYCVVDEASQITLPTCLGPLRFADKFILVGDHFQLPPLVRNPDARKGGLDTSLFRRLSEAHPESVVDLAHQYRMNEDIMLLSNKLIYSDRLRCGSAEVAQQFLHLPAAQDWKKIHRAELECHAKPCWIEALLEERCKVAFVDTDAVPAKDSRVGSLVQNEVEARLVFQFTEALLAGGIDPTQIGVISLYRQQVKLLSHLFQATPAHQNIEILTADRSQGRDKDCMVISMVRSNDAGEIGDLLKDWRRMNVALTRARRKLVIFGSRKTLSQVPLMKEFFELTESKGWIYKLPSEAMAGHATKDASEPPSPTAEILSTASSPVTIGKRRARQVDGEMGKASPKKAKIDNVILKGRFVLQDLVNDSS